ncbi:hypothetical protein CDCA_CDCA15G4061 [Cyanidium caldarium]|uniref:Kinesin motor domain-containing protein n=1 Tax=Cyanidium caldarium TaxID=2771 RepID=A0AAV9J0V6_CYACA|nr:hypothetical protein CDCA_CDCA15G4061 [Cyanidium caldarium]
MDKENVPGATLAANAAASADETATTSLPPKSTSVRPPDASFDGSRPQDAVRVLVRVRPVSKLELERSQRTCVSVDANGASLSIGAAPDARRFTYDAVMGPEVTQLQVFHAVGKPIADSCLEGYNGTIFAYGQTGSGKTYSMCGPGALRQAPAAADNDETRGLMPRMFEYLFAAMARKQRDDPSAKFLVRCSYLEVYNEVVTDLLDPAASNLAVREDLRSGVSVDGLTEETVASAEDCLRLLERGCAHRHIGSTSMNEESSRSHSVFIMMMESEHTDEAQVTKRTTARLNMVDLAGSERQKLARTSGQLLREAGNINRSLSALGNVINALVDVANGKERHIHYRDSKLTFLLKDSLGGNTKTRMIATVSPSDQNFAETLSTLKFAQRAKLIKNQAVVNEDWAGADVRALQAELQRLRRQLQIAHGTAGGAAEAAHTDARVAQLEQLLCEALERNKQSQDEARHFEKQVEALKLLCVKRDKALQNSRMVLRLRDAALARARSGDGAAAAPDAAERAAEVELLREQLEHHPEVTRYAADNMRLQQRVRQLEQWYGEREGADCRALRKTEHFVEQLRGALEAAVADKRALEQRWEQLSQVDGAECAANPAAQNRFIALELYKWREREQYDQRWEEAAADARRYRVRAEQAESETVAQRECLTQLEQLLADKRAECAELETALETLKIRADEHTSTEDKVAALTDELREARERAIALEREMQRVELEREALREAGRAREQRLQEHEASRDAAARERDAALAQRDEVAASVERERATAAQRQEQLVAEHQAQVAQLECRLARERHQSDERLAQLQRLQDQAEQWADEARFHQQQTQRLEAELREHDTALQRVRDEVAAVSARYELAQQQLLAASDTQAQWRDALEEVATLRQQQREWETQRETQARECEAQRQREQQLTQQLEALRDAERRLLEQLRQARAGAADAESQAQEAQREWESWRARAAQHEAQEQARRAQEQAAQEEAAAQMRQLLQQLQQKQAALCDAQAALAEAEARWQGERTQLQREKSTAMEQQRGQLQQLQEQLQQSQRALEQARADIARQQQQRQQSDSAQLQELRAKEQHYRTLATEWERQRQQRSRELADLQQRLAAAEGEARMRCDAQADAQREIARLRKQLELESRRRLESHQAAGTVQLQLAQVRSQLATQQREHEASTQEMQAVQTRLADAERAFHQTQLELQRWRDSCARLEEENRKLGGHHNLKQRIHHHIKVKEENAALRRERERLLEELEGRRSGRSPPA